MEAVPGCYTGTGAHPARREPRRPVHSHLPPGSCLFTGTLKSYFLARFPDTIPAMNCHCQAAPEIPGGLLTPTPTPSVRSAHPSRSAPTSVRWAARLWAVSGSQSSDVLSGFFLGRLFSERHVLPVQPRCRQWQHLLLLQGSAVLPCRGHAASGRGQRGCFRVVAPGSQAAGSRGAALSSRCRFYFLWTYSQRGIVGCMVLVLILVPVAAAPFAFLLQRPRRHLWPRPSPPWPP